MLMFKTAWPCFCQRISLYRIKKLQNEFINSSADIVRAVTTNIIRITQVLPLQESNTIFHKLPVCQNMHLTGLFPQNNSHNSLSHSVIDDVVVVVVVALIPAVFPQPCLLLLSCSPSWRWWGERFTPAGGERIFLLSFLKRTHNIIIWFIHIFSKCKMVSCSFSI